MPEVGNPSSESPIGEVIEGRYKIIDLLGSGGMGVVYRAEHLVLGRQVAVKLLHRSLSDNPEIARRFEREVFATGQIDHPNCVTVSDGGRMADGTLFMVLELLSGESLSDFLDREGRMPVVRALHIVRHVLRGLVHAHENGIVHRDVKPSNIVLVTQGSDREFAKVLDFGLAKLVEDGAGASADQGLTQLGETMGTPAYMSPEQAFGQPVDQRTDVYAVCAMLFEMVAGRQPFIGDTPMKVLQGQVAEAVPAIAEVAPDVSVPEAVEDIIRRGMAKELGDRIGSSAELAAHIDTAIAELTPGEPASGDHTVITYAVPVQSRRDRRLLWALGGVAAILLVGLVAAVSRGGAGPAMGVSQAAGMLGGVRKQSAAENKVAELLAAGQPEKVIRWVSKNPKSSRRDAGVQLVLGHANASVRKYEVAFAAYLRAVKLDVTIGSDQKLGRNLEVAVKSKSPPDAVYKLLERLAKGGSRDHRRRLVALASEGQSPRVRRQAMAAADRAELGGQVDRLKSYSLDLVEHRRCSDRKKVVAKLRALGNRDAVGALEKARMRARKGGILGIQKKNANACLKSDVDDAIAYLNSL